MQKRQTYTSGVMDCLHKESALSFEMLPATSDGLGFERAETGDVEANPASCRSPCRTSCAIVKMKPQSLLIATVPAKAAKARLFHSGRPRCSPAHAIHAASGTAPMPVGWQLGTVSPNRSLEIASACSAPAGNRTAISARGIRKASSWNLENCCCERCIAVSFSSRNRRRPELRCTANCQAPPTVP